MKLNKLHKSSLSTLSRHIPVGRRCSIITNTEKTASEKLKNDRTSISTCCFRNERFHISKFLMAQLNRISMVISKSVSKITV